MAEIIPIDPKWDHLTQEAVRATNMGMTYGKYKAMQYERAKRGLNALPEPQEAEPAEKVKPRRKLEGKEEEILAMLDAGMPINGIAQKLDVDPRTIGAYCARVGGKLQEEYQQAVSLNQCRGRKPKVQHD